MQRIISPNEERKRDSILWLSPGSQANTSILRLSELLLMLKLGGRRDGKQGGPGAHPVQSVFRGFFKKLLTNLANHVQMMIFIQ